MNGGKFDGGALSDEQKQIRRFYAELLSFASGSDAISSGQYLDITSHNLQANNFSPKVHAFLRFHENERLLIVNSFNEEDLDIKVKIPREALVQMGLDADGVYIARDMLWHGVEVGLEKDFTFHLNLKPFSSFIFKIK
jgi:hypothetical protein